MTKISAANFINEAKKFIIIFIFLTPFYLFLYKVFSVRILSFGCFDDCANYMAGYFMLNNKSLYSEIFYNHIMGMAWLSYFIQKFHNSINIYDLILVHRQAILLLAFIFNAILIRRFAWVGFWFVLLYETTKFYVFGDRFLGESLVVYPAVYLFGLIFLKLNKRKLFNVDYLLCSIFTWIIIVMREPYIPYAFFALAVVLWGKINRFKIYSILLFFSLITITLINTNIYWLYFNDYVVNSKTAIKSELTGINFFGIGVLKILFYPIAILMYGKWNVFRFFEASLAIVFIVSVLKVFLRKQYIILIFILISLGLSNIRLTSPGTMFYEAYHMMVWFALFLFITIFLILSEFKKNIKLKLSLFLIMLIGWLVAFISPNSFIYDKIDQQEMLLTSFGTVMNVGAVINKLSEKNDTVFTDGADDMIIWQSKLFTPYKFSWYTSVMPYIPEYRKERLEMFKNNPPTFYYDFCTPKAPFYSSLPFFIRNKYKQIYENGKPSCLYILKSKLPKISKENWEKANEGFFSLP